MKSIEGLRFKFVCHYNFNFRANCQLPIVYRLIRAISYSQIARSNIKEIERPNRLAFNSNETILYVSNTSQVNYIQGHHYIRTYDLVGDKQVTNSCVFAVIEPGQPDGIKVDSQDNVFTFSVDSVQIYSARAIAKEKFTSPKSLLISLLGVERGNVY